jgi:hypothetical protein
MYRLVSTDDNNTRDVPLEAFRRSHTFITRTLTNNINFLTVTVHLLSAPGSRSSLLSQIRDKWPATSNALQNAALKFLQHFHQLVQVHFSGYTHSSEILLRWAGEGSTRSMGEDADYIKGIEQVHIQ